MCVFSLINVNDIYCKYFKIIYISYTNYIIADLFLVLTHTSYKKWFILNKASNTILNKSATIDSNQNEYS